MVVMKRIRVGFFHVVVFSSAKEDTSFPDLETVMKSLHKYNLILVELAELDIL